jgi:starch phosphorylase
MNWSQVRVETVDVESMEEVQVGSAFDVQARVQLGPLTPDDVTVELYLGRTDARGELAEARATAMLPVDQGTEGSHIYRASDVSCSRSGVHGLTVRVLPRHPDLTQSFLPGLIAWA